MMNQKKPYHRFNGGNKQGRPAKKPQRIHITVEQGQVFFRFLCPTAFAGGLIGHSGTIVKNLELETSARIIVEDALAADSTERLVYVVGSEAVDKATRFRNVGEGESGDVFDVSVAQGALLRVYERILEVETSATLLDADAKAAAGDIVRCCRLLAVSEQIGALMGREGKRIDKIRKQSGAYIRVLSAEQLPPCADPADELIQITGDSIAVRKALFAVSKCLQENPPKEKASTVVTMPSASASYGPFQQPQIQSYPSNGSSLTPFLRDVVKRPPESYSSFKSGDPFPNVDGSTSVEVVFRMLCSVDAAGSVIGKGGSLVKALQDETRASIYFAASLSGCHERAITISALENVESHTSPAQNALLRVFARVTEALTKSGLISKWNSGDGVTARLLIPASQAGCLIGVRGTIVSDLQRITGTRIQVLEGNQVPRCASNDERVVQIAGEYVNVQNGLIEVTRRLKEKIFSSKGLNVVQSRNSASHAVHDFVPMGRVEDGAISAFNQSSNHASYKNGMHTLEHKMEDLNLSQDVDDLQKPKFLPHENFAGKRGITTSTGSGELGSEERSATVTNMTVEVAVPQNVFNCVFDEDGSSLARLREISGAKVELQHPSPGTEGKVIISGTPDQTLAGQSLLRAYIVTAK